MILPTKHIQTKRSLIGMGAGILSMLDKPYNVSSLWHRAKKLPEVRTFETFVITLDFLFALDAIGMENGFINKK
ncbi:MAG: ABC-three component system middle component 6 [Parcubacteria group bacterium]|jgi:hypothetical protein